MRERHLREAEPVVGAAQERVVQADRAADDELYVAFAVQSELVDVRGEPFGGEHRAVDRQRDHIGVGADVLGDAPAFLGTNLPFHAFAGMFGGLLVGDLDDVELAVAAEPFAVFGDGVAQILLFDPADANDANTHYPAFYLPGGLRKIRRRTTPRVTARRYRDSQSPSVGDWLTLRQSIPHRGHWLMCADTAVQRRRRISYVER